jgi:adenylosuccinate synthase
MDKQNYVVIGAGYGDEGKGLMTDYLTRATQADYVARFNGGAQAGHTVVDGEQRHVFGHYGAGTLAGARTILGRKFIVNPFLLAQENKELESAKRLTGADVLVHPEARVSTIYDMMLNQLAELQRGEQRHGSCGCGINETVTRHEHFPLKANASLEAFERVHEAIRYEWVPKRAEALGIDLEKLIREKDQFLVGISAKQHATSSHYALRHYATLIREFHTPKGMILEGAQGLMLDERLGAFPHVTRSITGLPYAVQLAAELKLESLTPVYVTRAYSTRHGAGPMGSDIQPSPDGFKFVDETNVDNAWQGSIRTGALYIPHLRQFIKADVERGQLLADVYDVKLNPPVLAITCLDQLGEFMRVVAARSDGVIAVKNSASIHAAKFIADEIGIPLGFTSHGPTHQDVRDVRGQ